jgi:hypothetical protein
LTSTRAQRAIPGLAAPGADPDDELDREIRGSTTVLEVLRLFPDGRAARLLAELGLPCAHCGGAVREPLTLAARRHRRDPRALLEAFRALDEGYPDDERVARARMRVDAARVGLAAGQAGRGADPAPPAA